MKSQDNRRSEVKFTPYTRHPSKVLVQVDVTAGVAGLFVRNPGWYQMFNMRLYESMDVRPIILQ